jgi:GAF domain-containing protein
MTNEIQREKTPDMTTSEETGRSQLQLTLRDAARLASALEDRCSELSREAERLSAEIHSLGEEKEELIQTMVACEHRANRLGKLYVATYALHSTHDPVQVQAAIGEIVSDLLGGERFALLLRSHDGEIWEVTHGSEGEGDWAVGARYEGGDALVDATLMDGRLHMEEATDSNVVAALPLLVQDSVIGALVILKLFDHRPPLGSDDRELLEAISLHASFALFTARLVAGMERRLQNYEFLVRLVRGENLSELIARNEGEAASVAGRAQCEKRPIVIARIGAS